MWPGLNRCCRSIAVNGPHAGRSFGSHQSLRPGIVDRTGLTTLVCMKCPSDRPICPASRRMRGWSLDHPPVIFAAVYGGGYGCRIGAAACHRIVGILVPFSAADEAARASATCPVEMGAVVAERLWFSCQTLNRTSRTSHSPTERFARSQTAPVEFRREIGPLPL